MNYKGERDMITPNHNDVEAVELLWREAHKAMRIWWDSHRSDIRKRRVMSEVDTLQAINEYLASLCKLLGIAPQQIAKLEDDYCFTTKEAVLGGNEGVTVAIGYWYTSKPQYYLTMSKGPIRLSLEVNSTQELVEMIHKGYSTIHDLGSH
jgi:hypothetical protein